MNRNFGIGILILCFVFSNINMGWAVEGMEISPVIVQPYEVQELNQQMMDRDRQNRDEEIAIKQLVEDNDKLTQSTLAHQQDEGLSKINQTMLSYRDALLSRDRARIVANGNRGWNSRYGDLIALTEDADAMTVHQDLENKSGLLSEKYQMLTELKDEMTALNEKLRGKSEDVSSQKDAAIDGFKKIAQEEQDKVQMLTQRLGEMDQRIAKYDEIIAEKDHQISQLKEELSQAQSEVYKLRLSSSTGSAAIAPIVVNNFNHQQAAPEANSSLAAKDEMIKEKQAQVDLLKSELEDKLTQENNPGPKPKDEIVKEQENQIAILKAQLQELSSKEDAVKSQADQMAKAGEQFKNNSVVYADVKAQIIALRNKIQEQDADLKAKNESINWLNQVVLASKNKAKYYQLSSQINQVPMKQVQEEMRNIKNDFAQHFRDYDHFENAVASLKNQVGQLGLQLSRKQGQVDLLKSELENKITESKGQHRQDAQVQQDLKAQLQDKEGQIVKMKADVLAILQGQANKEIYHRNARAQVDDRIKLAQVLINLQQEETALLEEKNNLRVAQNNLFDRYASDLEVKIKELLDKHQIQAVDAENHMQELKNELDQKEQQVNSLETELKNKIAEEKNQSVLAEQLQDLKTQLQDKEDQITTMKVQLEEGQKTKDEADFLRQQLVSEQDKADQLKQQLDIKTDESDKTTVMMGDYQHKLESRNNAYNEQSGQITGLNAQLQEKEAQIVKIKKDMYDLQTDIQAKDLSLSMVQQKMTDEKINEYQNKINGLQITSLSQMQEVTHLKNELAMARQQLEGTPSIDELDFLRTGLKKAITELNQKDAMIFKIKANADEYAKEFKEQSQEFQSLKDQLADAQDEIQHKNEDLKYKDMALTRLKYISRMSGSNLKALMGTPHENKVEPLQAQLKRANMQIKDLRAELDQLKSPLRNDTMEEKLKQALDKIDEQGRMINVLAQKLQEAGQSVDLTKEAGN